MDGAGTFWIYPNGTHADKYSERTQGVSITR